MDPLPAAVRAAGLALGGTVPSLVLSLLPPFWSLCWRLRVVPWTWTASMMFTLLRVYRLALQLPGPVTFAPSTPFSPSTSLDSSVSISTPGRYFLGSLFLTAVRSTNASSSVSPVDETTSVSYIEPFYCSPNLPCDDLLVPAGRCPWCEAALATNPCAAAMVPGWVWAVPRARWRAATGSPRGCPWLR